MKKPIWIRIYDGLEFELTQAREEKRLVTPEFEKELQETVNMADGPQKAAKAAELFERVQMLDYEGGKCVEPDALEEIQTLAPGNAPLDKADEGEFFDHVYGAWLGRAAGCLLGKPVECWRTPELHRYLKATDNYPITRYLTRNVPDELKEELSKSRFMQSAFHEGRAFIEDVKYMPEDDDTNYTLIGLKLLEENGRDFTPEDVGDCWLCNLPIFHVCTAERIAYRNLVMCIEPPKSASYCNGYREWIGAQIRADIYGYVNPAKPREASTMAWRDASISHVKNGIYGEMWVAAMLAAAFTTKDIETIIRIGLNEIPSESRLAKGVEKVISWWKEGIDWEEAQRRIHAEWDENSQHDWCHTVSNAQIVAAALLLGGGDFGKSLGIAVTVGFDTDCNGATVGSVLGLALGAKALPEKWTAPLNDQLASGVDGFGLVHLSEMAKRTVALIEK